MKRDSAPNTPVEAQMKMLPTHLNDQAASLYRRWAARYDRGDGS